MKVILTGSTGMIGNGVLQECLINEDIEEILLINRKPLNLNNKKIKEVIVEDLFDLSSVEKEFVDYDACFFCVGTSSVGLKEDEYMKITYYLPLLFANTLAKYNYKIDFCYISANGVDLSEKSSTMWKRIKGQSENALLRSCLEKVYIFRPAVTKVDKTSPKRTWIHKVSLPLISILYPILKTVFPKYCTTTANFAKAMIEVVKNPNEKKQFEVDDVNKLIKGKN